MPTSDRKPPSIATLSDMVAFFEKEATSGPPERRAAARANLAIQPVIAKLIEDELAANTQPADVLMALANAFASAAVASVGAINAITGLPAGTSAARRFEEGMALFRQLLLLDLDQATSQATKLMERGDREPAPSATPQTRH